MSDCRGSKTCNDLHGEQHGTDVWKAMDNNTFRSYSFDSSLLCESEQTTDTRKDEDTHFESRNTATALNKTTENTSVESHSEHADIETHINPGNESLDYRQLWICLPPTSGSSVEDDERRSFIQV